MFPIIITLPMPFITYLNIHITTSTISTRQMPFEITVKVGKVLPPFSFSLSPFLSLP